jgi:hypothetical protein
MLSNTTAPATSATLLDTVTSRHSIRKAVIQNLSGIDRKISPNNGANWLTLAAMTSRDLTPWADGTGIFLGPVKIDRDAASDETDIHIDIA